MRALLVLLVLLAPGHHLPQVRDLLAKANQRDVLKVRMHPQHGTYVDGLSTKAVTNAEGVIKLIAKGNERRSTASTKMNDASSRSHAIFTLHVIQYTVQPCGSAHGQERFQTKSITSKVHLVDLAGSERVKMSGVKGAQLEEAKSINSSLSTLGRVIETLADRNSTLTPAYRESMLTWILMNSFGGNSRTIMIATISPSAVHYDETLNTMRYARRACKVVNITRVNIQNVKCLEDIETDIGDLPQQVCALSNNSPQSLRVLAHLASRPGRWYNRPHRGVERRASLVGWSPRPLAYYMTGQGVFRMIKYQGGGRGCKSPSPPSHKPLPPFQFSKSSGCSHGQGSFTDYAFGCSCVFSFPLWFAVLCSGPLSCWAGLSYGPGSVRLACLRMSGRCPAGETVARVGLVFVVMAGQTTWQSESVGSVILVLLCPDTGWCSPPHSVHPPAGEYPCITVVSTPSQPS